MANCGSCERTLADGVVGLMNLLEIATIAIVIASTIFTLVVTLAAVTAALRRRQPDASSGRSAESRKPGTTLTQTRYGYIPAQLRSDNSRTITSTVVSHAREVASSASTVRVDRRRRSRRGRRLKPKSSLHQAISFLSAGVNFSLAAKWIRNGFFVRSRTPAPGPSGHVDSLASMSATRSTRR